MKASSATFVLGVETGAYDLHQIGCLKCGYVKIVFVYMF